MNKNKQLFVNLGAGVIVFIVQFFINFWLSPFVVGRLGEEAYGFITLANNFTQYATLIAVSINSMASRFISLEYNRGNKEKANLYYASVFWMNVILSLLVFAAAAVLIFNIQSFINVTPALVRDVKLTFALSFLNLIISFISTCYNATTFVTNRMDLHAYTQIATNLVKMLVILGSFLLLTPHIYFVSLATALSSLVAFAIYLLLKRKLLPEFSISRKYFSLSKILELAKSGVWLLISDIGSLLLNGMDLLIANLLISQAAMGRLSISKQLPIAIGGLLGFLSNIFTASFTGILAQGDKEQLAREVKFTFKILGVFLAVPFAGLIVYGTHFFTLWLPESVYDLAGIRQVHILMLLTLSNVIVNAFMYSIHSLLIALDKVRAYSLMVLGCSIVSIVLTLLLTTKTGLGVYAIAGTSTIVLSLMNLIAVPLYAERTLKLKPLTFLRTIFKNHLALVITCILFFVLSRFLPFESWTQFILSCAFSALIGYILNFFILLNRDEKQRLLLKFKSKLHKS